MMMHYEIPYGKGSKTLSLPENRIVAVLRSEMSDANDTNSLEQQRSQVMKALAQTIGSRPLSELVRGKKKVAVISSDHTRPVPSHITMPILLAEIRKAEPRAEITILVATGLHRATTQEELVEKYGREITEREKIIVHDCHDDRHLRKIGILPSGGNLVLSAYALGADLLIAEGFIEPHFFAGFSGGRKSVLPGIAGYETVVTNHCSEFIADKNAASGVITGNPIHEDMEFAARAAGLSFILNVILDEQHRIIDAVAGDAISAHRTGCERLMKRVSVNKTAAPIVITSNGGYPLDQNLYQMVKGIDTAEKCCREDSVIIAVGECSDGIGGDAFYRDFAECTSAQILSRQFLERDRAHTQTDQWQSQILARILSNHRVIMVTSIAQPLIKNMKMQWAPDIETALTMAEKMLGDPKARIVVIPQGVGVILR
jgi:nickel-dependent lactate racemase